MRYAYEGNSHNRVRITFDHNLAFKASNIADLSLNHQGWHQHRTKGVVVEIKFTGHYPAWMNQMVKHFGLRQQSFSKYARSIERSCLMRFCAPKIPMRIY